jgi:prepilin-type N-terminal cleavage/methylation domain-containing protein
MKTQTNNLKAAQGTRAFTLVELLVVISIIGIIAALTVGVIKGASRKRDESAAKAQLAKIETALEDYKKKFGTYPPDFPAFAANNPQWNPLAYELGGLRRSGVNFISESDPSHTVTPAMAAGCFSLAGFVNADPTKAKSFLNLKSGTSKTADYVFLTNGTPGLPAVMLLQVAAEHPSQAVNVWRYRAYPSNGHNPKAYDLWAEIKGKSGTNIIGNWR